MPGANILESIYEVGNFEQLKDPGTAANIIVNRSPSYCGLRSAAAETRLLPLPTIVGAYLTLCMEVDGGDITLTVASAHNESGDTTFVFSDPGQWAQFVSVKTATGTFAWRLTSHYAIGNQSPTEAAALDGLTATVTELNARNAAASRRVAVTDAANYTVLAANSGKIHVMPDFTASCTLTLPAAADGLEYTFISKAVAADAQNWVFTSPAPLLLGGIGFADLNAGAGADEISTVFPNGSSHVTCTVVTPSGGTRILLFCDGTSWIINGIVVSDTVPSFS